MLPGYAWQYAVGLVWKGYAFLSRVCTQRYVLMPLFNDMRLKDGRRDDRGGYGGDLKRQGCSPSVNGLLALS
ncbi:hypothetical protein BIY28_19175 [Brenneria goodwinii]|nr:hypothetical protein BIY28_19175 [Brenneria goodwinii]